MTKTRTLIVLNEEIRVANENYISLTDMLRSKDGDFFISDWLRNRNTLEYLGIWERVHNPVFNWGEFAITISIICQTRIYWPAKLSKTLKLALNASKKSIIRLNSYLLPEIGRQRA